MRIFDTVRSIKRQMLELNLFTEEADASHLRIALISTRVYVVLFTMAIVVLAAYSSLVGQTRMVTIRNPSRAMYEHLQDEYPNSLACPCEQITMPYGAFVSVSVDQHPLCSSRFVSDEWIRVLFDPNITILPGIEFRSTAYGHFCLLAAFCSIAKRAVNGALDDFYADTLLSSHVLPPRSLAIRSDTQSEFVRTSTTNAVVQLIDIVRGSVHNNQLQTLFQTPKTLSIAVNVDGSVATVVDTRHLRYKLVPLCSCGSNQRCTEPAGFLNNMVIDFFGTNVITGGQALPGLSFVTGCYVIEALFQSTLDCFFDETCLQEFLAFYSPASMKNVHVLNTSATTFDFNTTVETMVRSIFVERWSTVSSFPDYFAKCAPIWCTYIFTQRANVLFVLTTFLGLYGGLTVVLRRCIPLVIAWWFERASRNATDRNGRASARERLRSALNWARTRLVDLNLFRTAGTRTDLFEQQTGRISTRLYLVLMLISIVILLVYSGSSVQLRRFQVHHPSLTAFDQLHSKYSSTLQCPCEQITIPYRSFVSIDPTLHPVCVSWLTNATWIIGTLTDFSFYTNSYTSADLTVCSQHMFNAMLSLCSLASTTLTNAWRIFEDSSLITAQIFLRAELMQQTRAALAQFQANTIVEFK